MVKPLLKDTPDEEHNRNYLSTKDSFQVIKNSPSYSVNTLEEWTTSLQWTKWLVPSNVSIIKRFNNNTVTVVIESPKYLGK